MWILNEKISLLTSIKESLVKIANIGDTIFALTDGNSLLKGSIQTNNDEQKQLVLNIVDNLKLLDIGAYKEYLYIIDTEGNVFVCSEQVEILHELHFIEQSKCPYGHPEVKQVKIKSLAVGSFGKLFISTKNQLWGCGYMPQVSINSDVPKKVSFFSERKIYDISIGSDSAAILIAKKKVNIKDDNDHEIFKSNCPSCFTASLSTTPDSQDLSKDICPLGIKLKSNTSCDTLYSDSGTENEVCVSETNESQNTQRKVEKNIIFRNTEAAKDFLSRQISRMSSVGEEYLIECTEKPTKLIKENVSNMATFVFEGVKTVGDKVATLSRHVSASSEYNGELDNNNESIQSKHYIKEDLLASGSQSTSERDLSETEVYDRLDSVLEIGSDLLNREVWCWGNIVSRLIGKCFFLSMMKV